jgi:cytochrome c biogenesis protein CcmG/thiol:disulfide interchange protein DsbE
MKSPILPITCLLTSWIQIAIMPGPLLAQGLSPPPSSESQATVNQARPWLGIAIEKGVQGVAVKGVLTGTPAEQAGLKVGDEVLSIDGKGVSVPNALITQVQSSGVGQTVTLAILRNSKTISVSLKLVARPDELKLLRDKLVGKPAPEFNLKSVHGKEPGSTKKLIGRVALVEFWATWCAACRSSHPRLSAFAKEHPEIAVLAISDEEKAPLVSYAKEFKPNFTIFSDSSHKVLETWMAAAIPMLAVIDKKGYVAYVTIGAGESVEEAISEALKLK